MLYKDRLGNTVKIVMEGDLSGVTSYLGAILDTDGQILDVNVYFEGELDVKD